MFNHLGPRVFSAIEKTPFWAKYYALIIFVTFGLFYSHRASPAKQLLISFILTAGGNLIL